LFGGMQKTRKDRKKSQALGTTEERAEVTS
jgi:hypothetical protein